MSGRGDGVDSRGVQECPAAGSDGRYSGGSVACWSVDVGVAGGLYCIRSLNSASSSLPDDQSSRSDIPKRADAQKLAVVTTPARCCR
jgi:hypothetical protein